MDIKKLFIECNRFSKFANAVCSKCGDDNPYLDSSDPNFLCRQCRTRAQAWGGDDKKEEVKEQNKSSLQGFGAMKTLANDINDKVEEYLAKNRQCSRARRPLHKTPNSTATEGYISIYADYDVLGLSTNVFRQVVDVVLNPMLGTAVNDRVESDGRCVAYWNVGGNIDEEAYFGEPDYGKAIRVRLTSLHHYGNTIRFVAIIPNKI